MEKIFITLPPIKIVLIFRPKEGRKSSRKNLKVSQTSWSRESEDLMEKEEKV